MEHLRYERKFVIGHLPVAEAEGWVRRHPALFRTAYPQRAINNIYLDTADLRNYSDHVQGAAQRHKVRVRWYGNLLGSVRQPVLEFKLKEGLLGRKESHSLGAFEFNRGFSRQSLLPLFRSDSLPPAVRRRLEHLEPSLLNRYQRRYYCSADGCFRLTLDFELEFYPLRRHENSLLGKSTANGLALLELKYDSHQGERTERIANTFPFRVTRFSKYVLGLEADAAGIFLP